MTKSNTIGRNDPKRGTRLPQPFEPLGSGESELGSTPVQRMKSGPKQSVRAGTWRGLGNQPQSVLNGPIDDE
jgi:hypothetical protein